LVHSGKSRIENFTYNIIIRIKDYQYYQKKIPGVWYSLGSNPYLASRGPLNKNAGRWPFGDDTPRSFTSSPKNDAWKTSRSFLEINLSGDVLDFKILWCTLPETNIAPENGWLED